MPAPTTGGGIASGSVSPTPRPWALVESFELGQSPFGDWSSIATKSAEDERYVERL
jgi:hypothetical protein